MNEEEREAARLLEPLRQYQPPASADVDLNRAMRSGKRTVLVRQVAGTVTGLVAVLVIAATFTLPSGQPPATPSGDFGATTQEFGIGSAAGFTPLTYETGVDRQRAVLTAPELDGTDAVITMYGKGISPLSDDDEEWTPSGEEAPEVNGRAALWLDEPVTGDGDLELAWQWKSGAWGFARLTGPDANRDRAHKVARSVEPDADVRVSSPVRLPAGVVPDAEVTGTLRTIGDHERPELVNETRYTVAGNPGHWITVGSRLPETDAGESILIGDRPAVVDGHRINFLDGSGLFIEISADLELDRPLTDLAAQLTVDPDFTWPSTPPLSSPSDTGTSSSTSPSGSGTSTSSSPSEPTSEPTTSPTG